jgi:hypothetical protein
MHMQKVKALPLLAYVHAERRSYTDAPWIVSVRFSVDMEDPPYVSADMVPTRGGRIRLADLTLDAMIMNGHEYEPRWSYRQVFSLELRDAEACTASLRTITGRVGKMAEAYGPSRDLETAALRAFTAFGVGRVKVSREAVAVQFSDGVPDWVRADEWHVRDAHDGARTIGATVRALVKRTSRAA